MAAKVKIKLNSAGVRELMKSPEMQAILQEYGERVRENCGDIADECEVNGGIGQKRAHVNIHCTTPSAYYHNLKHNTLLKALK